MSELAAETSEGGRPAAAVWETIGRHREELLKVALRHCASYEDAEDCVHEAMIRAATYPRLEPERSGALLHHIVRQLAANGRRRRGRGLRALARLRAEAHCGALPEEPLLDADEARWLAGHVGRLPDRERAVFVQRASGHGAGETAALLDISYKSAESAFTRARHRLLAVATSIPAIALALLRRLRHAPVGFGAALATAAAIVLLQPGILLTGRPPNHAALTVTGTANPRADRSQANAATTAAHPATPSHTVTTKPVQGAATPGPLAAVQIGNPSVVGTKRPVYVVHSDGSWTVTQSLYACLQSGPSLQLQQLGCPPPSGTPPPVP